MRGWAGVGGGKGEGGEVQVEGVERGAGGIGDVELGCEEGGRMEHFGRGGSEVRVKSGGGEEARVYCLFEMHA